MTTSRKQADFPRRRLLTGASPGAHAADAEPWDSMSAGTGMGSGPGWLSFRRIVDIPFEECVAALETWRREGCGGGLQAGHSRLRGPVEHDRGSGTCRVEVRLAQGPLRPLLRMRLDVDCWSPSLRTALELIPCGRVLATASYFRAGHLLLDSLTHSLQLEREIKPNGSPRAAAGSRPRYRTGVLAERAEGRQPQNDSTERVAWRPRRTPLPRRQQRT
jgi:hypothetical protein